jgi:hypothetical protein
MVGLGNVDNTSDLDKPISIVTQTALNTKGGATDVADNANNIATNTANIASNDTDIATNASNIATNTADIASNDTDISTNSADIATNTADIATNSADIATNTADIATNTADIATNTADIATKAPLAQPNVQDSLTVTATASPDQDAKIELVDKSTGSTKQGGLYKRDGSLYIGTFTDHLKNLRMFQQGSKHIYDFPNNSGIRFHNGDLLETYRHSGFNPSLRVGGVTQTAYTNKTSYYTKFGRKVTFHIEMTIQAPDTAIKSLYTVNPTSNFEISGMPFTAQWDTTFLLRPVQGFLNCSGVNFPIHAHMSNNTTTITFERGVDQSSAAPGTGVNVRDLQLNDFVNNPFDFVKNAHFNKFRFTLSGVYMTTED